MWRPSAIYEGDLAFIHHTGFGAFAQDAAPGLLEMFRQRGVTRGTVVDRKLESAGFTVEIMRQDGSLPLPPRRAAFVEVRKVLRTD